MRARMAFQHPGHSAKHTVICGSSYALTGMPLAELFDDFELPTLGHRKIHIHLGMKGARHHLGRAARPLVDLRMIERCRHVLAVERARFSDCSLPQLDTAVHAGGTTPGGKLDVAGKRLVVLGLQLRAKRVVDTPVVVQTRGKYSSPTISPPCCSIT